jgi:hypothetical protein
MLYRVPEFLSSRLSWDPPPTPPQASFVSPRRLDPPTPPPQAKVAPPMHLGPGGGDALACPRGGGGGPSSDDWTETMVFYSYSIISSRGKLFSMCNVLIMSKSAIHHNCFVIELESKPFFSAIRGRSELEHVGDLVWHLLS